THDFEPDRYLTRKPRDGLDRQTHVVMRGDRPAVQQDQALAAVWPGRGNIDRLEMILIRKVVHNKDLLVRKAVSSQDFPHGLIHRDDPIGQRTTDLFLQTEKPDDRATWPVVPAHVELWHRIVDVEYELASTEPGDYASQNQYVG